MSDKVYPNLPSFNLADGGPQERHAAYNQNKYGEAETNVPTRGSQIGFDLLYRSFQRHEFGNAVTTVEEERDSRLNMFTLRPAIIDAQQIKHSTLV